MEITNLTKKLVDMRGDTIKIGDDNKEIVVKDVLANVIASGFERPSQVEVALLYNLASTVYNATNNLEVSSEQVALINKCIDGHRWEKGYTPFMIGQVLEASGLAKSDKKAKK